MKTLLILRHAKSSWEDRSLSDHDRPLNPRGRRDAPRMGRLLEDEELWPALILSSTASRAATTTQLLAEDQSYAGEIRYLSELYLAGPHDYINTVRRVGGDADSLMVVGHNPGLELLVQMMTGDWERMPTAALACIHIPIDDWTDLDTTGGELAGIWRPKELD